MTITCIHMTSDIAENCPNCNPEISTAIEATAPEPVAWRWRICYREEWCWSIIKPMFSTRDLEQGTVFDVQPLYTTPADAEAHLTALLRAEYERGVRDTLAAADKEAKGKVHIGGQAFRTVKLDDLGPAALALLKQEGR